MKVNWIKKTGERHIKLLVFSIGLILLILLIKTILSDNNGIYYSIIGIVIGLTTLTLPFLKNYRIIGEIEIQENKIIFKNETEILNEIFFSNPDFEYLKFNYGGYDGSIYVDSSFIVGIFSQNNGANNSLELVYRKETSKFSIFIKNSEEYKKIKSILKVISKNGINIYIQNNY